MLSRTYTLLLWLFCFALCSAAPKVSICVPVYNVEPWLPAALDSACNQTLQDIEIVCVDDGSTDGSLAILKSYAGKDPRIMVLENGQNRGTLYSRVRAALASTGNYVLWLDPDDELFPEIAEKTLAAAQESGADIVFFNAEEVLAEDKWRLSLYTAKMPTTAVPRDAAEIFTFVKNKKLLWFLWGRIWRGDLTRNVALGQLNLAANSHVTFREDRLLFYFTAVEAKSYVALPDVGYRYYRTHGGITTRKNEATQKKKRADADAVRKAIDKSDNPGKKWFLRDLH
ncbi:MAG: glycosyltransferase [Puniceicoccales bacterium]|jgi:glycosyltransferase involved in cell wall biosynthesis|nr:glycosyltransferase [Puniceicoccales bacterium]